MSRFVDYFVIIGFDYEKQRGIMGSGKVMQRFPVKNWPDTPFIDGIELVCVSLPVFLFLRFSVCVCVWCCVCFWKGDFVLFAGVVKFAFEGKRNSEIACRQATLAVQWSSAKLKD